MKMIKPYGDSLDDGLVQLAFTLPVPCGARAKKAAELYVKKLNFGEVAICHAKEIADNFTYFVVFAKALPGLDWDSVQVTEVASDQFSFKEINQLIREHLNHRLVVVGASIGSDAHTVGIDAIMNMKGYNQDYGLERYPEIEAINLGAQVEVEALVAEIARRGAEVVLVSQTVTQKDAHLHNFTALVELLEAERLRQGLLLIAGGPRVSHELAVELGYDAGFGPGTLPSQVASYMVTTLLRRRGVVPSMEIHRD